VRGFHPPLPLNAGGILCRGRAPRKEPRATVIAVLSHGFWLGCPKTTPARRRLREAGEGGAILLSAHRALQCRSLAIELALLGLHQAWISPRAPTVVFRRRRTKGVATLTARPWRMAARIVIPVLVVGMIVKWLAESARPRVKPRFAIIQLPSVAILASSDPAAFPDQSVVPEEQRTRLAAGYGSKSTSIPIALGWRGRYARGFPRGTPVRRSGHPDSLHENAPW